MTRSAKKEFHCQLDSGIDSRVDHESMNSDGLRNGVLRSGELARRVGVSTDTLRHYERKGLLAPYRSPNGYRDYPPDAEERVHLIRRALAVGFTLDELAAIFAARRRGAVPCRQVRALAAAKVAAIEAQIRDLSALRDELDAIVEAWDARLAATAPGEPARLLESLAATPVSAAGSSLALAPRWSKHQR
jgi:DNA-binding transcriptional MerR regulator